MLTTPLRTLISCLRPHTALLGICFTPYKLHVAITNLRCQCPKHLSLLDELTADSLLALVKQRQVGGLLLGGSALFRMNGLTQFGARSLVSKIGGDPFSSVDSTAAQLPVGLWIVRCRQEPGDDAQQMLTSFLQSQDSSAC